MYCHIYFNRTKLQLPSPPPANLPALPGPPLPPSLPLLTSTTSLPPTFDPLTVMPYENSPLLPKSTSTTDCVEYGLPMKSETSIYDRFTPRRKRMILVLISLAGMIPCESESSLGPCRVQSTLTGRSSSVCDRLVRAVHPPNISRPSHDGGCHQASRHPASLLPLFSMRSTIHGCN